VRPLGAVQQISSPAAPLAGGRPSFPASSPSFHYAPHTSSPYIQRAVLTSADCPTASVVAADNFWPSPSRPPVPAELDLSALTLAASPAGHREAQASAAMESAVARAVFQSAGVRTQQQLGLPVLESAFGGVRPMYESRPSGRPHYPHPPQPLGDRGEHEDIKVIHFGVV